MKKSNLKIAGALILSCLTAGGFAQNAIFLKAGSVEFEKKTNSYALMKEMADAGALPESKVDDYKSKNPQFKTERFILYFDGGRTRFQPLGQQGSQPASIDEWFSLVAGTNVVYSDLPDGSRVALKQVFGTPYHETDSIRKIEWKITAETRDIAGFHCRRADAVIDDSLYVVAFYSIEIPVSGGPESLSGLPGMILGLAIPRQHVTWFATRASAEKPEPGQLSPPTGGKEVSGMQFKEAMSQLTKSWNTAGSLIMLKALL